MKPTRWSWLLPVILAAPPAIAADAETPATTARPAAQQSNEELAKAAQNPVADLISFPFQSNTNFGFGPSNAAQEVLNIQPVIPIHMGEYNIITRTIIPLVWQPNLGAGQSGTTFALGSINTTLFVSPARPGALIWGIGPVFGFPTNTSPAVPSAKWTFGPSVVLLAMPGHWVIGILANNVWSFAGGGSQNVNSMLIQYFVNYNFGDGWYLTSSPIITADWNAQTTADKWVFPLGGGVGKIVRLGRLPLNISLQAYDNVWHPPVGPTWTLRAQLTFLF